MIVARNNTASTVKQTSVLKMLLKWRDYIARTEDESVAYTMPNNIMF